MKNEKKLSYNHNQIEILENDVILNIKKKIVRAKSQK